MIHNKYTLRFNRGDNKTILQKVFEDIDILKFLPTLCKGQVMDMYMESLSSREPQALLVRAAAFSDLEKRGPEKPWARFSDHQRYGDPNIGAVQCSVLHYITCEEEEDVTSS